MKGAEKWVVYEMAFTILFDIDDYEAGYITGIDDALLISLPVGLHGNPTVLTLHDSLFDTYEHIIGVCKEARTGEPCNHAGHGSEKPPPESWEDE